MNRGINTLWMAAILPAVMLAGLTAARAEPPQSPGAIEAVTVYRGQALVTRVIPVDAPAGAVELVVPGLPPQIVPDSLYADSEAGVQVRAVRYRTRAVQEEPREEVRKLDAQIQEVQKALLRLHATANLLKQKDAYLTSLEGFTSVKVKEEMVKGMLNPETVKGVSDYLFQQRTDLAAASVQQAEEQQATQEKLALLQRQRAELTVKFSPTIREAVIFLDKQAAGKAAVRLNYMVSSATWSPMYTLRSTGAGKEVQLEYSALVQQMSGENWDGVKLTLSTASQAMVADAPILTPLWVTLAAAPAKPDADKPEDISRGQQAAVENLRKALAGRQRAERAADQLAQDWGANIWANRLQVMDLVAGKDVLLAGRELASGAEALAVSYAMPGPISVPSRSDQQMIQIAALKLQGEFYYLAAPILTPYVYQQADILNSSDVALLNGPVQSYVDGQFMGVGRIPLVAKGQRFTVGFGVDSQLRSARELADKTDKVQGGNRELTFTYRLLIDNYKDKAVKVRLMDRLPDPKGADIRVTLGKTSAELSTDQLYLRTLRKSGILWWDVDVPAKSSGATAKTVEYDYKLEFDRNMHLAEPTAAEVEKQKMEFMPSLDAMFQAH